MLRYRWQVAAAMVFAGLSAGGLGAGLLGVKPVLDNILGKEKTLAMLAGDLNEKLPAWAPRVPESVIAQLPVRPFDAVLWIVIGLGVLTVLGAACNFLHAYLSLTVISRTIANIRREAFHRAVHLPLKTVVGKGPSDLVSRIVYDTATLGQGFNALLSRVVAQATKGLAVTGAAFYLNWKLAAGAMVAAPLVGIIIRKLGKRIRRASKRALEGQAGLYRSASEVMSGLRVVKVHTSERSEAGRFHRMNKQVVAQEFRVRTARALASPLVETVSMIMLGAVALVAVYYILQLNVDRANSLLVLGLLAVAAATLKPLTGFWNDVQQAGAAAVRLDELMAMTPEPGHDAKLPKMSRHAKEIAFEDVRLTYPGVSRAALDGVSLTIEHGKTVAFVGPNGCGKTTLLSLIPRLFDPDAGLVLVDGNDVRRFAVRSLREQIGVVTQETVLFTGTLAENIAYGASDVTPEKIRDAARRARAEEFILQKPGGYEYRVGEGGSGLSGGQKQRLAIARAILRDPAILILDEATSMIDAESEAKIAEAVAEFVGARGDAKTEKAGETGEKAAAARADDGAQAVKVEAKVGADGAKLNGTHGHAQHRGRTCLIVAHRLSTVIAADAIVVMDGGKIVDKGTHAELLGRCTIYQGLVANQMVSRPEVNETRTDREGNKGGTKGAKGEG
jgi:ABC-type multidrug transport system fused ATPase/permease subunit